MAESKINLKEIITGVKNDASELDKLAAQMTGAVDKFTAITQALQGVLGGSKVGASSAAHGALDMMTERGRTEGGRQDLKDELVMNQYREYQKLRGSKDFKLERQGENWYKTWSNSSGKNMHMVMSEQDRQYAEELGKRQIKDKMAHATAPTSIPQEVANDALEAQNATNKQTAQNVTKLRSIDAIGVSMADVPKAISTAQNYGDSGKDMTRLADVINRLNEDSKKSGDKNSQNMRDTAVILSGLKDSMKFASDNFTKAFAEYKAASPEEMAAKQANLMEATGGLHRVSDQVRQARQEATQSYLNGGDDGSGGDSSMAKARRSAALVGGVAGATVGIASAYLRTEQAFDQVTYGGRLAAEQAKAQESKTSFGMAYEAANTMSGRSLLKYRSDILFPDEQNTFTGRGGYQNARALATQMEVQKRSMDSRERSMGLIGSITGMLGSAMEVGLGAAGAAGTAGAGAVIGGTTAMSGLKGLSDSTNVIGNYYKSNTTGLEGGLDTGLGGVIGRSMYGDSWSGMAKARQEALQNQSRARIADNTNELMNAEVDQHPGREMALNDIMSVHRSSLAAASMVGGRAITSDSLLKYYADLGEKRGFGADNRRKKEILGEFNKYSETKSALDRLNIYNTKFRDESSGKADQDRYALVKGSDFSLGNIASDAISAVSPFLGIAGRAFGLLSDGSVSSMAQRFGVSFDSEGRKNERARNLKQLGSWDLQQQYKTDLNTAHSNTIARQSIDSDMTQDDRDARIAQMSSSELDNYKRLQQSKRERSNARLRIDESQLTPDFARSQNFHRNSLQAAVNANEVIVTAGGMLSPQEGQNLVKNVMQNYAKASKTSAESFLPVTDATQIANELKRSITGTSNAMASGFNEATISRLRGMPTAELAAQIAVSGGQDKFINRMESKDNTFFQNMSLSEVSAGMKPSATTAEMASMKPQAKSMFETLQMDPAEYVMRDAELGAALNAKTGGKTGRAIQLSRSGFGDYGQLMGNLAGISAVSGGSGENLDKLEHILAQAVSSGFDTSRMAQNFVRNTTMIAENTKSRDTEEVAQRLSSYTNVMGAKFGQGDELAMNEATKAITGWQSMSSQTSGSMGAFKARGALTAGGGTMGSTFLTDVGMGSEQVSNMIDQISGTKEITDPEAIRKIAAAKVSLQMSGKTGDLDAMARQRVISNLSGVQSGMFKDLGVSWDNRHGGQIKFDAEVKRVKESKGTANFETELHGFQAMLEELGGSDAGRQAAFLGGGMDKLFSEGIIDKSTREQAMGRMKNKGGGGTALMGGGALRNFIDTEIMKDAGNFNEKVSKADYDKYLASGGVEINGISSGASAADVENSNITRLDLARGADFKMNGGSQAQPVKITNFADMTPYLRNMSGVKSTSDSSDGRIVQGVHKAL